jgi:hypothetical protein
MVGVDTKILLKEELIDLLYDLSELSNVASEIDNFEELHNYRHWLFGTIAYVIVVLHNLHEDSDDLMDNALNPEPLNQYVDKSDLLFHSKRIHKKYVEMLEAYKGEFSESTSTLLHIIRLHLSQLIYYAK